MAKNRIFLRLGKAVLLFTLVLALLACVSLRSGSHSLQQRFDSFNEFVETLHKTRGGISDRAFVEVLVKEYENRFSSFRDLGGSESLNATDLGLLFRLAHTACSYSAEPKYAEEMRRHLDRLITKDAATDFHFSYMYQAYILTREFDRAAEIYHSHHTQAMELLPEFVLPDITADQIPTELVVSNVKREVSRRLVTLPEGPYILVVFHPNCHFSQRASTAITKDGELSALFQKHAKWLAPATGHLDVDTIQHWNQEHWDAPATIAYRAKEWPLIDTWALPTFYFFQNDKVEAKIIGWPPEGHNQELRDAARGVGLLPASKNEMSG